MISLFIGAVIKFVKSCYHLVAWMLTQNIWIGWADWIAALRKFAGYSNCNYKLIMKKKLTGCDVTWNVHMNIMCLIFHFRICLLRCCWHIACESFAPFRYRFAFGLLQEQVKQQQQQQLLQQKPWQDWWNEIARLHARLIRKWCSCSMCCGGVQ